MYINLKRLTAQRLHEARDRAEREEVLALADVHGWTEQELDAYYAKPAKEIQREFEELAQAMLKKGIVI